MPWRGLVLLAALAAGCKSEPPVPLPTCGDGAVDTDLGEECDFGPANGPGAGCEIGCRFSCSASRPCAQTEPCRVQECRDVMVGPRSGKACQRGALLADGAACDAGAICVSSVCRASTCGDGYVDPARAEQCEPPGSDLCSASCKGIDAGCGNGTRELAEQCDDGNALAFDGCGACRFEQSQRVISLKLQFTRTSACPANVFGEAFGSSVRQQVQQSLDDGVKSGSLSLLLAYTKLADPRGQSDSAAEVGLAPGVPVFGPGYDGAADLDWWYGAEPESLDATRAPKERLPATFSGGNMTAGPGRLTMRLSLGAAPTPLLFSGVQLKLQSGAATAPRSSADGKPPGHLASESLDPALVSFPSAGGTPSSTTGDLCGNVSADSLARAPAPAALLVGGGAPCGEGYPADSSLLDVVVGGCHILTFEGLVATQPDQADAAAPAAGAGAPYKLLADATTKKVTGCQDKGGAAVDLAACLRAAAFSSHFKLATGRVILR